MLKLVANVVGAMVQDEVGTYYGTVDHVIISGEEEVFLVINTDDVEEPEPATVLSIVKKDEDEE